jgi:type III secretion system YscQ/HrcQ family protein
VKDRGKRFHDKLDHARCSTRQLRRSSEGAPEVTGGPIKVGDLRRAAASDFVVGGEVLRAVAALPPRIVADVGAIGSVELTLEGFAAPDVPMTEHVVFGVGRGRVVGRLLVDATFARRLIGKILPRAKPEEWSSVSRLGVGERGLIAGLITGLFEQLDVGLTLSLDGPDAADPLARGNVGLALAVSAAGSTGWVQLEIPREWLVEMARRSPGSWGESAAALKVEARIEIGRTFIAAGALAALVPGDALVFDGVPAPHDRSAAPWSVRVVIGDHAADADLVPGAQVTMRGGFLAEPVAVANQGGRAFPSKEVAMESRTSEDIQSTAVLAAAPVEVIAEVGRITLRGDVVLGLRPGTVLPLGRERTMTVALRIGGEIWAEGELVDVDGELGVQVTTPLRIPAIGRPG